MAGMSAEKAAVKARGSAWSRLCSLALPIKVSMAPARTLLSVRQEEQKGTKERGSGVEIHKLGSSSLGRWCANAPRVHMIVEPSHSPLLDSWSRISSMVTPY